MSKANDSDDADAPHFLSRFEQAQIGVYEQALAEIRRGRKESHWMWYIFPQVDGLGSSSTSKRFSIKSVAEAQAYLSHPELGKRLMQCADAVISVQGRTAVEIFGITDSMKLQSAATLFAHISPPGSVFDRLLDKYFQGARDDVTLQRIGDLLDNKRTKMCNLPIEGGPALELLLVGRGEFIMGTENELFSEFPPHRVTIATDFFLGKFPVTQLQWQMVMGSNPSAFIGSNNSPVDNISWSQAVNFCNKMSANSGRRVRLPSEAEWEYACRAGTREDFFFGSWGPFLDEESVLPEARRALGDFAWFDLTSAGSTQPVGQKLPNPWGLYDMIGNVWEWCADVWCEDYKNAPSDGSPRHDNLSGQPQRCLRGGAWDMNAFRCRSSYRSYDHKDLATNRFGLRVAVDAD